MNYSVDSFFSRNDKKNVTDSILSFKSCKLHSFELLAEVSNHLKWKQEPHNFEK